MAYYVAEGAVIKGNITIGEDSGIWYNATIRGDSNQIAIGSRTNVQDNAVVHVSSGYPVSDDRTWSDCSWMYGWKQHTHWNGSYYSERSSDWGQLHHWCGSSCDTEYTHSG